MNNENTESITTCPLNKKELRIRKVNKTDFPYIERSPVYIVLDSLKCAHNIGTILRLADALLISKVFICGNTIIPPNKKIKISSRGSEKWVPWEYRESISEVLRELKENGVFIMSAEVTKDSIPYDTAIFTSPVCIVLGREYDGVSNEALSLSNCVVHLPMYGMCNSINVSTTASVLMYYVHKELSSNLPFS